MQSSVNRGAMIRAAKVLLSSITRVLLLADIVVVKQLLLAKDNVCIFFNINGNDIFFNSLF